MFTEIDINSWNRKQQFDFFKGFDDPFYNMIANIDVSVLYDFTKKKKLSFFLSSLFISLKTANEIPEFRCRIENGKVGYYDQVAAKSTILDDNNTFLFCRFEHTNSIKEFCIDGNEKIQFIKEQKKLLIHDEKQDIIHYSVIPWISFTSYTNARNFSTENSVPKIVFGKHFEVDNIKKMPISVEVNHALVDGYHVGKYFELIQQNFNNCAEFY